MNNTLAYINEAVEVFSSEEDDSASESHGGRNRSPEMKPKPATGAGSPVNMLGSPMRPFATSNKELTLKPEEYLAVQAMQWATRRANALQLMRMGLDRGPYNGLDGRRPSRPTGGRRNKPGSLIQWTKTLLAVTWKNYIRLRRNPPVLVFQFMLPAIQVILFCLCIGGEPFDVPVAVVNDELVPKSSVQFLNGLNRKIIRQVKYDNLTSAMEAVRRGRVWGAIHIPDKYSEHLQSRLIMGEEVTNETISNGTIRVYPDLTNLHLALTLENTFRETFLNFSRNSLEDLGYDRSLADLPIQIGKPVYGTLNKNSYLEFMAPGVVISISYVMATGLTALAFILERRDGLLERSLVSGVQTSQILLAHAINQVFVMIIQISLVLGCTFFIFEIPSRGSFFWVILLILLQGCTGMGFGECSLSMSQSICLNLISIVTNPTSLCIRSAGLLVSAICAEENTAVMMVVGTFYTNLILAGIIWPIEAMPHWLRPVSYAQPQTLPTDTLRHILSRGWGITEPAVLLGFAVTIGWLFVFLTAAGIIFKYSR